MLASIGDITESVAYQEIFAEGIVEGKAEGKVEGLVEGKVEGKVEGIIEGQIRLLNKLLADGLIEKDYYEKTVGPLKEQLQKLEKD